jgi:hypothetical protein
MNFNGMMLSIAPCTRGINFKHQNMSIQYMSTICTENLPPALEVPEDKPKRREHTDSIKYIMAKIFYYLFLLLSVSLACLAMYEFVQSFTTGESLANGFIKTINIAVVSLAIFELGVGIGKEYISEEEEHGDIYSSVRRSVTRFVAVVCIALVLEGLIMVIKYSQLELAGNLSYPVAIIASASLLLLSLGGFLKLTSET